MENVELSTLQEPIALVVDDEPLLRMDAADMVTDAGFSVVEAATADEAMAFLERQSDLQLVLTDVQMPGRLNGLTLAQEIADRWPHICVIVASGATVPGDDELPDTATFMNKPLNPRIVMAALQKVYDAA